MRLSITAYKFNSEPHNWCGGVIKNGTEPIIDSARCYGITFRTMNDALNWARDQKRNLKTN